MNYSFMDEHGGLNEGVVTPADMLSFARQVAMAMVSPDCFLFLRFLLKLLFQMKHNTNFHVEK